MTENEIIEDCVAKYALVPSPEKRAAILKNVRFSAGLVKAGVHNPNAWQREFDLRLAKRLEQKEKELATMPHKGVEKPTLEKVTWEEVGVMAGNTAKVLAVPTVVIGGTVTAVAFVAGAAKGVMIWAAANAAPLVLIPLGVYLLVGFIRELPKWNSSDEKSEAGGGTTQNQNITVNVNINAANGGNAEQK